jgi:NADPH-dependent ferric siderophore reductase
VTATRRLRREPPAFRQVEVLRVERLTARMVRVTLGGVELAGFTVDQPATSVRVLLPTPGGGDVVVPSWNGNEFLMPDGRRPTIRTLTPWRVDPDALELEVGIVVHGGGVASDWALSVESGEPAAISGPGRGYAVDRDAPAYLIAGDETAIPAITQVLDAVPDETPAQVRVEVANPDGRLALTAHPHATVEWCDLPPGAPPGDALGAAVRDVELADGSRVWAAGEAAAVQRIRRHLFDARGLPRAQTSVRGYWKHGRAGDGGDDE